MIERKYHVYYIPFLFKRYQFIGCDATDKSFSAQAGLEVVISFEDAGHKGDDAMVAKLLSQEGQSEHSGKDGMTILHLAALTNNVHIAQKLCNSKLLNEQDLFGNTPLLLACKKGHWGVATCFLRAGADSRVRNRKSKDALYYALKAKKENGDIFLLLESLLKWYEDYERKAIIELFIFGLVKTKTYQAFLPLVFIAVAKDCLEITRWLLDWGIDPLKSYDVITVYPMKSYRRILDRSKGTWGGGDRKATLLHIAAGKGSMNVVKLLLEKKADVDAFASDNMTPLQWASRAGCNHIVKVLEDAMRKDKGEVLGWWGQGGPSDRLSGWKPDKNPK